MAKFIIHWNVGYGDTYIEVEADSMEDAIDMAYAEAMEEVQSSIDYGAMEYNEENAEEYL